MTRKKEDVVLMIKFLDLFSSNKMQIFIPKDLLSLKQNDLLVVDK